jgi:hypothetical protein
LPQVLKDAGRNRQTLRIQAHEDWMHALDGSAHIAHVLYCFAIQLFLFDEKLADGDRRGESLHRVQTNPSSETQACFLFFKHRVSPALFGAMA